MGKLVFQKRSPWPGDKLKVHSGVRQTELLVINRVTTATKSRGQTLRSILSQES